jgi:hypothetical protein
MNVISRARATYGGVYLTILPDGRAVPWKPLSVQDFIRYHRDFTRGLVTEAQLENEVFSSCVLDDHFVRNIDSLPAGDITTVVANILQASGPHDVDTFNSDLQAARGILHNDGVKAIHDVAALITLAFPYKPEEIYEMDYETFLTRAIQAEDKLIQAGMITEPIAIEKADPDTAKQQKRAKIDAKKLWEAQQFAREYQPRTKQRKVPDRPDRDITIEKNPEFEQLPRDKWWKRSPVLEQGAAHGINFNLESQEVTLFGLGGHEKADLAIARHKLTEDAQVIYKDVLEALAAKKKPGGE